MSTLSDIRNALKVDSARLSEAREGSRLGDLPVLRHGRLHEATGPLGHALALSLAAYSERSVFWVSDYRHGLPRARGMAAFASPHRIINTRVASRDEALWAGEQALRCAGTELVVIETRRGPDLFESRRLQIAALVGGGLGLVLIRGEVQSSAAQTRWECSAAHEPGQDWHWRLLKNKQGVPGEWAVRGDPDPALTYPPDLLPSDLAPTPDKHNAFTLTTTARAASPAAAARPLSPA